MEQVIDGGGSVSLSHPGYPHGTMNVTRKEDLPSEEELALLRPDLLDDCIPRGIRLTIGAVRSW
jgi:hypothetical protein